MTNMRGACVCVCVCVCLSVLSVSVCVSVGRSVCVSQTDRPITR